MKYGKRDSYLRQMTEYIESILSADFLACNYDNEQSMYMMSMSEWDIRANYNLKTRDWSTAHSVFYYLLAS